MSPAETYLVPFLQTMTNVVKDEDGMILDLIQEFGITHFGGFPSGGLMWYDNNPIWGNTSVSLIFGNYADSFLYDEPFEPVPFIEV